MKSIIPWVGGGAVLIISYLVVSNALWLLLGSKLLQSLPGVNNRGFNYTARTALLLIMSLVGIIVWIVKTTFRKTGLRINQSSLKEEISQSIHRASKLTVFVSNKH